MNATVQCYLPRSAAEAVAIEQLRMRARAAGITDARLEYSYFRTKGRCRVTCRSDVATFLAGELRSVIAAAPDRWTREQCQTGLAELEREMARGDVPIGPSING